MEWKKEQDSSNKKAADRKNLANYHNSNLHGNSYSGSSGYRPDRWQNNRGGASFLPNSAGPYRPRNYYNPRYFVNDERFVSEFRFSISQATMCVPFEEPCEIGCYSRVEGGEVYFDDRSLRLFKHLTTTDIGADLNDGFDTFTEKKDLGSQGFGALLACTRHKNVLLQNMHFVTYPNNLNKLNYHNEERFESEKLLKFWIQSFLAGVPYIVIGFRDDGGRLVRTERLRTKDIERKVKTKGYWQMKTTYCSLLGLSTD